MNINDSDELQTVAQRARLYIQRGWSPVPLPLRAKRPIIKGWQYLRLTADDVADHFRGQVNVGILLGEPSGWIVDIDIDSLDVTGLAARFLPDTPSIFGRPGKPQSHRLYTLEAPLKTKKFVDPSSGAMIVEIRANGCQTLVPGSTHPSGEVIEWHADGEPRRISPDALKRAVGIFAVAVLVTQHIQDCAAHLIDQPHEEWVAALATIDRKLDTAARHWLGVTTARKVESRSKSVASTGSISADDPYVRAAVEAELEAVGNAGMGSRNDTLNRAAFALGQFVGAGTLGRSGVEAALRDAARKCGLWDEDPSGAEATISSGLEAGIKEPRDFFGIGKRADPRSDRSAKDGRDFKADEGAAGPLEGANDHPTIRIVEGKLPEICDAIEGALVAHDLDLYQRGAAIVRVLEVEAKAADERNTKALVTRDVDEHHLRDRAMQVAVFMKFSKMEKSWCLTDPKLEYFKAMLTRARWRFRPLTGTISAPTLRADGSILSQPGYDLRTGLLFDPRGATFPTIAVKPTKEMARRALDRIKAHVKTFPFVSAADCSTWLSGLLTTAVRRTLPAAPLHAVTATTSGSGKSLLIDMIAVTFTGWPAPVIAPGMNEEETGKQLDSALLSGMSIVSIDNVTAPLESAILCQTLTQKSRAIRLFHTQQIVEASTNVSMFANGNNLRLVGDLTRRSLVAALDPRCERPEKRNFDFDPVERVRENRSQLVVDTLTVLRAFIVAGRPKQVSRLGGFEAWSILVREALLWLGEADPCETMETARAADPKLGALIAVIKQWNAALEDTRVTASEVIKEATRRRNISDDRVDAPTDLDNVKQESPGFVHPDFREALLAVAGDGGRINHNRLGRWLARHQGHFVAGRRFVRDGERGGVAVWKLETIKQSTSERVSGVSGVSGSYSRAYSTDAVTGEGEGFAGNKGGPSPNTPETPPPAAEGDILAEADV